MCFQVRKLRESRFSINTYRAFEGLFSGVLTNVKLQYARVSKRLPANLYRKTERLLMNNDI